MTTNNQYYKQIAESLGGSKISGNHSDNYYLHLIAVHYCGNIYTQTECNGKYLKDIAEEVCDTTYTEIRFNNFYLHQWAEQLVGEELPNNSDNYFLKRINRELPSLYFNPSLDGTDEITSWTSMTNKTEEGIFYSHGSFLTDGWSNGGLWELDFDIRSTNWHYVGAMPVCAAEINPFTDAKNNSYSMTSWEGLGWFGGMGLSSWDSADSLSKITNNQWHHVKITKLTATKVRIVIDDTYTAVGNYDNLPNHSTLHIGSRDNPSSRNYGGIVQYKNIIVKPAD